MGLLLPGDVRDTALERQDSERKLRRSDAQAVYQATNSCGGVSRVDTEKFEVGTEVSQGAYVEGETGTEMIVPAKTEIVGDLLAPDQEIEETLVDCPRCGFKKIRHAHDRHLCVECAKAENNRYYMMRKAHNEDWMARADDAGIPHWEQQPGETMWEFSVWCAYRDAYPGKKPSYRDVAMQLGSTYDAVRKVAGRWMFNVRLQSWMAHVNEITLAQRREEILGMNKQHINMALSINEKLEQAIGLINVHEMKPGDLVQLAKLSTELERKARMDTVLQEDAAQKLRTEEDNPNLKKSPTSASDLGEIVKILAEAGALGDITQIGVRHTKTTTETTEVVAKED